MCLQFFSCLAYLRMPDVTNWLKVRADLTSNTYFWFIFCWRLNGGGWGTSFSPISNYVTINFFPRSRHSIYQYHSVSIFLKFLARGRGKRSIEKPLLLCTIIFFFSKKAVLPCFIPHRVLLSHKKLGESLS